MLNIIICEDNKIERDRIQSYIKHSIDSNHYDCIITLATANPKEAVQFAKSHSNEVNVYFLDIDLKSDINGIEAARLIRDVDINGYFIFITGHKEYSMMTFEYKLQALDYLDKSDFPQLSNKINQCMKTIHKEFSKLGNNIDEVGEIISIKSGSRHFNIPIRDILYFEAFVDHKIMAHTIDSNIEFYDSIKALIPRLDSNNFRQVHRSYVVNYKHIYEIDYNLMVITMDNGDRCPISRGFAKELDKR